MKYLKNRDGFIELAGLFLGMIALASVAYFAASIIPKQVQAPQAQFGGSNPFAPVQSPPAYLSGSGITSSATSITLTSLKLSDASTTITMSNFVTGIGYGTLEPGTSKEEQISFTGITQNADGTATLTGVTRGVNFVAPCNSVSAFQRAHAGGTKFVLSNTACFYNQFLTNNSTGTVTAVWQFGSSSIPQLTSDTVNSQVSANGFNLVDYNVLASTSFAGVATANPGSGIAGIGMFSSLGNMLSRLATSTYLGNTYYLFPQSSLFAATSTTSTTLPMANFLENGFYRLDPSFISTSSVYTWTGNNTYTGTSTFSSAVNFNASSSFTSSTQFSFLPLVPSSTPTLVTQVASKQYVDSNKPSFISSSTLSVSFTTGPTYVGTSTFTLANAGHVFVYGSGGLQNGTASDGCQLYLYVDGATSTLLSWQNNGAGGVDAMPLSISNITPVLSAASHTLNIVGQNITGGTCSFSGTTPTWGVEYMGN